MKTPKVAWVVFDLSNGNCGDGDGHDAKNYAKWFKTRAAARNFRWKQLRGTFTWTPSQVFKYLRG